MMDGQTDRCYSTDITKHTDTCKAHEEMEVALAKTNAVNIYN
jgi:hypothetical protein